MLQDNFLAEGGQIRAYLHGMQPCIYVPGRESFYQGCHLAYLEARFLKSGLIKRCFATEKLVCPKQEIWLNFGQLEIFLEIS